MHTKGKYLYSVRAKNDMLDINPLHSVVAVFATFILYELLGWSAKG